MPLHADLREDSGSRLGDTAAASAKMPADIAKALMLIDRKLNRILDLLDKENNRCSAENICVEKTSDISGSGICVLVQGTVEIGQFVKISLYLPEGWPSSIEAFGEVVRVELLENEKPDLYEVGIKFVRLNDEERERIIAYTFQQQRNAIRRSKTSE
jgi:hypothetical protein